MAYEDVLLRTDFFGDAPTDQVAAIAATGRKRILSRGDHLFEAGEEAESMYIVISGRVAIAIASELDKRESMGLSWKPETSSAKWDYLMADPVRPWPVPLSRVKFLRFLTTQ